jgi:predicted AAA+ superfamily ATPase
MIRRSAHARAVSRLLSVSPVVAILGARQVGKTTLARQIAARRRGPSRVFDLENDDDRAALADPMRVLSPLRGLVVLDEVQHAPELFRTLRVLADRPKRPARFLVLGSASERLLRQSSESLAGRIAFHELPPLGLDEVGRRRLDRLWLRGGFPASFLAMDDDESLRWRKDFVRTFVERDLPQLGVTIPAATMSRFWSMLAHVHGQVWNASRLAAGFGVSHTTVMRWLDLLTATFVVRVLPPWQENLGKRQVKAPKVYVADTGLLHAFHDVATVDRLEGHPVAGPSWESLGIDAVVSRLGARRDQCFFWATHQGAELDLLVVAGGRRLGFEFKRTSAPTLTPSMRIALADLRLDGLVVVHAGAREFPMAERVRAVPLARVSELVKPLAGARA